MIEVLELWELKYKGLAMKLIRDNSRWAVAEVSELGRDSELPRWKWSGRGEHAFELFSAKGSDVDLDSLRQTLYLSLQAILSRHSCQSGKFWSV